MGTPRVRPSDSVYWRAMMSTEPPGGKGTTRVMARVGYLSAAMAGSAAAPARPRAVASRLRREGAVEVRSKWDMANTEGKRKNGGTATQRSAMRVSASAWARGTKVERSQNSRSLCG